MHKAAAALIVIVVVVVALNIYMEVQPFDLISLAYSVSTLLVKKVYIKTQIMNMKKIRFIIIVTSRHNHV